MTPSAIVRAAKEAGLDLIGICDHNSAENVPALTEAALGKGLDVLGGMEVTSREEVHVLGLFDVRDNRDALEEMQHIVLRNLPGVNEPEVFGEQLVCGGDDSVVGHSDRLLIGATTLTIHEVVEAIRRLGGVAIASHVDRESFGIIGQVGFVPEGVRLDAMELSPRAEESESRRSGSMDGSACPNGRGWRSAALGSGLPLIAASDAHRLSEIGRSSTTFRLAEPNVDELRKAFSSRGGVGVIGRGHG
jgi:PHP family Zn ribbon phosphoesterase